MSKQANKTTIGIFVLGAIVLAVTGVLVFGSGKFMADTKKAVLYFDGSVKGLNIGSPVMFRGVKIGSVVDILLRYDPSDLSVNIPVIIEINRNKFTTAYGKERPETDVRRLIDQGLRAQLQLQSLVTGQLMIDFDVYPDEPFKLVGTDDIEYDEIPTIPSGLQKLTKTIEQLPLDELFSKIIKTVGGIERLVNSPDVSGSFASIKKTLDSADTFLVHTGDKLDTLLVSLEDTSDAAHDAFVQAEKTLALEEGSSGELASDMKDTLRAARDALSSAGNAMKQAEQTLAVYEGLVGEDSNLVYEVNTTMRELSAAARSIRYFTDYINRHPEALLRGKK